MDRCLICGKKIPDDSPYSVCFDPDYKRNVWGGDSHQYIGLLCEEDGLKLNKKAEQYESEARA